MGRDEPPEREVVRFRALPALSFPGRPVSGVDRGRPAADRDNGQAPPPEMVVSFMGLTGPQGVLPQHYTTLLMERLRQNDHALRDFLDLFNHRLISHFYRAWEKYRLPVAYERCQREGRDDLFTECLFSLIGMGTDHLRGRLEVNDDTLLYYGGHFAQQTRSAASLELMLGEHFQLPLQIRQFNGQWLSLDRHNWSCLPFGGRPTGQYAQLGRNAVLGERVWDVQSKFRIYIGPLKYRDFRRLMPSGDRLSSLIQLTRVYVGHEFDFDIRLVLKRAEVPRCQLGDTADDQPRLGWNTWICSRQPDQDVSDATFTARL